MRIIVEGPDGGGKSTLVHLLWSRSGGLDIVRNPLEDKMNFDNWWPEVLTTTYHGLVPLHDRFFYSELVYGPVIRGRVKVKPEILQLTRDSLRQDALLIYARPPTDIIKAAITQKPQMIGVHERIGQLIEEYDKLMMAEHDYYGDRFYIYNFTSSEEPATVTRTVRRYLDGELR